MLTNFTAKQVEHGGLHGAREARPQELARPGQVHVPQPVRHLPPLHAGARALQPLAPRLLPRLHPRAEARRPRRLGARQQRHARPRRQELGHRHHPRSHDQRPRQLARSASRTPSRSSSSTPPPSSPKTARPTSSKTSTATTRRCSRSCRKARHTPRSPIPTRPNPSPATPCKAGTRFYSPGTLRLSAWDHALHPQTAVDFNPCAASTWTPTPPRLCCRRCWRQCARSGRSSSATPAPFTSRASAHAPPWTARASRSPRC